MITERHEPRKRKITTMTMRSVSLRVVSTSLMASWIYSVESYGMPSFIPAGIWASIPGIWARTWRMTSSEFAVGSTQIPMNVAVSPLKRTSSS